MGAVVRGLPGRVARLASYPSGQRDLTVNQTALHSGVRIPHSPQMKSAPFTGRFSLVPCCVRDSGGGNPVVCRRLPHSPPIAKAPIQGAFAIGGSFDGYSNAGSLGPRLWARQRFAAGDPHSPHTFWKVSPRVLRARNSMGCAEVRCATEPHLLARAASRRRTNYQEVVAHPGHPPGTLRS